MEYFLNFHMQSGAFWCAFWFFHDEP